MWLLAVLKLLVREASKLQRVKRDCVELLPRGVLTLGAPELLQTQTFTVLDIRMPRRELRDFFLTCPGWAFCPLMLFHPRW